MHYLSIMIRLTYIFFFVCSLSFGQVHNQYLFEYAKNHMGQKVGDGLCISLIDKAEGWGKKEAQKTWNECGFDAVPDSIAIIPGDIVSFENVSLYSRDTIFHHIGIVYEILNDSIFSFASQNVGYDNAGTINRYGHKIELAEDSKVVLLYFNFKQWDSGKLLFFRKTEK